MPKTNTVPPPGPEGHDDDLLPIKPVCNLTGLSEGTVRRYTAEGLLPHYRFGRAVRYRRGDVKEFRQQYRRNG